MVYAINLTDKEKEERLFGFMKKEIKKNKDPYISYKTLIENAEEIVGKTEHPDGELWPIIEPLIGKEIYEHKFGNTKYYGPMKMIDFYCDFK